jgi:hypothetical protein
MKYRAIFTVLLLTVSAAKVSSAVAHVAEVEIRNGFVVLSASVNGVEGRYILDSGAPGLIMNSKYCRSQSASRELHGLHGQIKVRSVAEWRFQWNGFLSDGDQAMAIDLSYLEHSVKEKIDGLVGVDLFEGYYVMVDYANSTLQLWNSIPAMFRKSPYVEFRMDMQSHVPVIILRHQNKDLKFAFDSGSAAHILNEGAINRLEKSATVLQPVSLIGADQKVVHTHEVSLAGLTTNGIALPATAFVLTDLTDMKSATQADIDGILGQPLFKGRIVLFDRERKFLRVSEVFQENTLADVFSN